MGPLGSQDVGQAQNLVFLSCLMLGSRRTKDQNSYFPRSDGKSKQMEIPVLLVSVPVPTGEWVLLNACHPQANHPQVCGYPHPQMPSLWVEDLR